MTVEDSREILRAIEEMKRSVETSVSTPMHDMSLSLHQMQTVIQYQSEQIGKMWHKLEAQDHRWTTHDTEAQRRIDYVNDHIKSSIAPAVSQASEALAEVRDMRSKAAGAQKALNMGLTVFGGLVGSIVLWVLTETIATGKELVNIRSRLDQIQTHQQQNSQGRP